MTWGGSLGGYQSPDKAKLAEARALVRALLIALEHGEACASLGSKAPCSCKHRALVERAKTLLAKGN